LYNPEHLKKMYHLDARGELILWYNLRKKKNLVVNDLKNIEIVNLFED